MGSIVELFARLAHDRATAPAVWSRGERLQLDFGDLAARVDAWATRLDLPSAHPVALAVGNGVAFPTLFLALRRRGLPVVPVDAALPWSRALALCRRLGIPTLLHGAPPQHDASAGGMGGRCLGDGVWQTALAVAPTPLPADTALVKLTSGSTGAPAGMCFRDEQLIAGIHQIAEGMGIHGRDRVLVSIPLSHSYGFDNGVLSMAVLGTPLVLEPSFFPAALLKAAAAGAVTVFPTVPPLVRSLGQVRWPEGLALRRVICAGGVLLPEVAAAFRRASGMPVHNFYGSTETGGICFEDQPLEDGAVGTVGRPLPGVSVRLDTAGRVTVDSRANRIAVVGCGVGPRDRGTLQHLDGPVVTGDAARWRADGRLQLTGRCGEFLNIGGRKVPVAEVEAALCALPEVEDAAVVGVDDAARGERAVAFVVASRWPVVPSTPLPGLVLRDLHRVEALPYTDRGKLDRGRLRCWAADRVNPRASTAADASHRPSPMSSNA